MHPPTTLKDVDSFRIDCIAPKAALSPAGEDEWCDAIRSVRASGGAAVAVGGATALGQGNLLATGLWTALSTAATAGIREYSPDDMVVTAGAGTTLAALQAELSQQRQFVPIDAPCADQATMGGIVATNAQGLWRPAYGLPRDRLLGVRVALSDASIVKGGGKVVKNVAGYDLCKMFSGSWGTLGVITEVTFKTNPLPASRTHGCYEGADLADMLRAAHQVAISRLDPAYLVVARHDRRTRLYSGCHGGAQATAWQADAVDTVLGAGGLTRVDGGWDDDALRHASVRSPGVVKARIAVRPSDLAATAPAIPSESCIIHAQTGVIEADFGDLSAADFGALRREVERAVSGKGHLVWTALPPELKVGFDVWGPVRPDVAIMRKLKNAVDPHGMFSPGRFIGRI